MGNGNSEIGKRNKDEPNLSSKGLLLDFPGVKFSSFSPLPVPSRWRRGGIVLKRLNLSERGAGPGAWWPRALRASC